MPISGYRPQRPRVNWGAIVSLIQGAQGKEFAKEKLAMDREVLDMDKERFKLEKDQFELGQKIGESNLAEVGRKAETEKARLEAASQLPGFLRNIGQWNITGDPNALGQGFMPYTPEMRGHLYNTMLDTSKGLATGATAASSQFAQDRAMAQLDPGIHRRSAELERLAPGAVRQVGMTAVPTGPGTDYRMFLAPRDIPPGYDPTTETSYPGYTTEPFIGSYEDALKGASPYGASVDKITEEEAKATAIGEPIKPTLSPFSFPRDIQPSQVRGPATPYDRMGQSILEAFKDALGYFYQGRYGR
jgi:hypothetical protein